MCYVKSCAADIFAITETWLTDKDCAHRAEVTPPGYKLYDHPRTGRTGGGTALMCRESITVTKVAVGEKRSFEFSEWIILGQGSRKIRIVIVYRLQYSPNHPVTTENSFFWSVLLSSMKPTPLVIGCIDILLPVITKIINISLKTGQFADQWKCALVHPLLKKPGLDLVLKNYRPVSNLQYISKLTEKAVFQQTNGHMVINSLYPELQSSYRQHHSTETALLKVMNDVLLNMNSQQVTLMVLLDLSSAFDTVNHNILLERLDKDIGMRGVTLDWFRSYLSNRCQQVCANGSLSKQYHLNCGVPQGSCLGPLLFSMYTSTLFKVIERHLPKAHCYADDTQLYMSFKPDDAKAQDEAIRAMENCIEDLRNWLIEGRLLLNDDKTEFLVIGTRQQLNKLNPSVLHVGDDTIDPSVTVRNLGTILDNSISMDAHINQVCKAAFYHIHNIRRVSKYLSQECLKTLIHAFVTSRLDYCNSLLYGLPKYQISKLQRVQNTAARLITNTRKYDHITPALYSLHWLPVFYRIHFKILIITFKAIYNIAPSYICNLVSIKSCSDYSLRSNKSLFLDRPKGRMLSTLGARSFYAAAPTLWNSLPLHIREITSLSVFKKQLKTYFFNIAYNR